MSTGQCACMQRWEQLLMWRTNQRVIKRPLWTQLVTFLVVGCMLDEGICSVASHTGTPDAKVQMYFGLP